MTLVRSRPAVTRWWRTPAVWRTGATLVAAALLTGVPGSRAAERRDIPRAAPAAELAPLRPFRTFTRQNTPGLPQSTVAAIVQDAEGVLWLATLDGLAAFDGAVMTDARTMPGAPQLTAVSALAVRREGGIYVGGPAGLHRMTADRQWRSLGGAHAVVAIAESDDGLVWVVDAQGRVHRVEERDPSGWSGVGLPADVGPAVGVAPAGEDRVWIATRRALLIAHASGMVRVLARAADGTANTTLMVDRAGSPWVGTSAGHLARGLPAQPPEPALSGCLPGTPVTALGEDWRGRIWAGCADGRLSVGPAAGPREIWGADEGLRIGARVLTLAVDRQGSLWIGRNGLGAAQLVSERWRHRSYWTGTERQVPGESVFGVWPRPDGGTLMGVMQRGLWRWTGTRVEEIGAEQGLTENTRFGVEPEPGVIWAGGRFGLYESRAGRPFRQVLGLSSGFVTSIERAPDGTWYALTSVAGLWVHDRGTWAPSRHINPHLPHLNVRGVRWLRNGELWVATAGGVAVVQDGKVHVVDATRDPEPFFANCILELANGDVWVGGLGGLLARTGNVWTRMSAADGLPGRSIYSLVLAPDGSVWAGGAAGVGQYRDGTWRVYGRDEGLIEDECALGGLGVLADGRVLVGTMGSLAVYDPSVPDAPAAPLRLYWRDRPAVGSDGIARLPLGERHAQLRWSAPWLSPTPVEYRTRVVPGSGEYSDPSTRGELRLSRLDPGRWTIEVQARTQGSPNGPWTAPLTLTIDVPAYVWERWWVRGAGLVLLAGIVPLAVRLRTRQLERRQRELQRAVDAAVAEVKTLTGLVPICASCKRIRDDRGAWNQLEAFLNAHSDAQLSHGICPDCMAMLYPDYDARDDRG